MGSALLNTTTEREFAGAALDSGVTAVPAIRATHSGSAEALRMQVAERLAAHRSRRSAHASSATERVAEPVRSGSTRSARIAATVAERYAQTPSYRAFLAAEAERAIEQARAAAEVAAMNAQAIVDAQQRMLEAFDQEAALRAAHEDGTAAEDGRAGYDGFGDVPAVTLRQGSGVELNLWPDLVREEARSAETARMPRRKPDLHAGGEAAKAAASPSVRLGGLTVRPYKDAAGATHEYLGVTHRAAGPAQTNRREERNEAEAMALDEEIAFRQAPVFEEPAGPPVPLPANLIEFPRQLVASRKARPRLAEGPLREEADAAPGDGQLRIFEVDAAQISTQPAELALDTPQWTSIWLDTPPESAEKRHADYLDQQGDAIAESAGGAAAVQAATIVRRVASAGIDAGIVVAGVGAFAATAVEIFSRLISWHIGFSHPGESTVQSLRLLASSISTQTGMQPSQFAIVAATAGLFLLVLYQVLFFWFSEATPGMRCTRIALCTFDDENPTRRAVRRRLGAMLLSACALGLGFAWALVDEERLTWHDRITRMYLRGY